MIKFNAEDHSYKLNGKTLLGVTSVIGGAGLFDFSKVDPDVLDRAGQFGTAVHKACELSDLGSLDEENLDSELLPYLQAWVKFKMDFNVRIEEDGIEKIVYSERFGFAGTLDRKGKVKGKMAIIDIKTGSALRETTGLQLAGYRRADCEMEGKRASTCYGVLLQKGGYKIKEYNNPEYDAVFLSLLNIKRWREKNKI